MRPVIFFLFFWFLPRVAPGLELPRRPFPVHGNFSAGCFLLNGFLPSGKGTAFVYLVDKHGRVKDHYIPSGDHSDDYRTRVILAKPLAGGRVGLLRPYDRSRLEILAPGAAPRTFEPTAPLHHDFLELPNGNFLTFGQSQLRLRRPARWDHSTDRFLGSPLVEWDSLRSTFTPLWDYLAARTPFLDADWLASPLDHGSYWVDAQSPNADFNFVHANSLAWAGEDRVLLSFRSLNKVLLFDLKTRQIIYSVGPGRRNTFSTGHSRAEFYRQHDASLLPDGHLLVFDNGRTESRVLELSLNRETRAAEVVRAFQPSPAIFSQRHGSAERLANGNILAFFPHTSDHQADVNHLIEFDGRTGKTVGQMDIDWGANSSAYRAAFFPEGCRFP